MKKVTSLLLALVMALALAVPAFAVGEEIQPAGKNGSQDVTVGYTAPVSKPGDTTYYFTVQWDKNTTDTLTYEGKNATYTWSGESMKYVEEINNTNKTFGWSGETGFKVTVKNQSNASVNVATSATNLCSLTVEEPTAKDATLTTAAVKNGQDIEYTDTATKGSPTSADFTYTYKANTSAGAPTVAPGANTVTVGTITVKVTK